MSAGSYRINVMGRCEPTCSTCVYCSNSHPASLEAVLAKVPDGTLILAGGDTSAWPHLPKLAQVLAEKNWEGELWLEVPAHKLDTQGVERLHGLGVRGITLLVDLCSQPAPAPGNTPPAAQVLQTVQKLEMKAEFCLMSTPETVAALVLWSEYLPEQTLTLEVSSARTWEMQELEELERVLAKSPNLRFFPNRGKDRAWLPPCAAPEAWASNAMTWSRILRPQKEPNQTFDGCQSCVLRDSCSWSIPGALPAGFEPEPISGSPTPWSGNQAPPKGVPDWIVKKRQGPPIICTAPWTDMEILDANGLVSQCCNEWTIGSRGNTNTHSIQEIWNGEGYRSARRLMANPKTIGKLCREVCPRLYDHFFSEEKFTIRKGTDVFVQNQLLLAEDIAERREVVRGNPLSLTLFSSSYCNYNCIMCTYGRTPRRDLPAEAWEQVEELLPTLSLLTLLGGEPLADKRTVEFLTRFDASRYPDVEVNLVTNGSLLDDRLLSRLERCSFGGIVVSANAGNAETYERVQRGLPFETFLGNLDRLINFRGRHFRPFGIVLSFVIQPANVDSLIEFAEIAHLRNLPVRFLPLSLGDAPELNFYVDPEQCEHVLQRLDEFAAWCRQVKPEWTIHATSAKQAVLGEIANQRRIARLPAWTPSAAS